MDSFLDYREIGTILTLKIGHLGKLSMDSGG